MPQQVEINLKMIDSLKLIRSQNVVSQIEKAKLSI